MSTEVAVTEQQKEMARFFARKIVEIYRKSNPNFSENPDPTDDIADALLHEYSGSEWKPSVAVTVSGIATNATGVGGSIETVEAYDSNPIAQKDFDVAALVNVHFEVKNPSEGEYLLDITANIFGNKVGGLSLHFKNGELSTKNEYKSWAIDIWYRASINFNDGVHFEFDADVKPLAISKFHIGPLNFNV